MPTFQQLYCESTHCDAQQFRQRVFWQCLYPHARPIAAVILLFNRRFFTADQALIRLVADATTMRVVREEVRDYFWDSNNRGWLRRAANIRVSGQRVKNLARRFLPETAAGLSRGGEPAAPAGGPSSAGSIGVRS